MSKKRILIAVKTYPTLSKKYDELVCTAGFDEEGNWVRLYPIPFRKLEYQNRYKKYSWIELDIVKNTSDFRPESYRPTNIDDIRIVDEIKADGSSWDARRSIVLKKVYTNLEKLIGDAKDQNIRTSLAVFKPNKIIRFQWVEVDREWDKDLLELLKVKATQKDLFKNAENPFEVVRKLPYKFSYSFTDETGKESTLMIEDWEIGQLFWNCLDKRKDEQLACNDVKKKYYDDFVKTKDLYFFLGTTRKFHSVGLNPFIIIGTFHPKPQVQQELNF
jgi:hypothetical protein